MMSGSRPWPATSWGSGPTCPWVLWWMWHASYRASVSMRRWRVCWSSSWTAQASCRPTSSSPSLEHSLSLCSVVQPDGTRGLLSRAWRKHVPRCSGSWESMCRRRCLMQRLQSSPRPCWPSRFTTVAAEAVRRTLRWLGHGTSRSSPRLPGCFSGAVQKLPPRGRWRKACGHTSCFSWADGLLQNLPPTLHQCLQQSLHPCSVWVLAASAQLVSHRRWASEEPIQHSSHRHWQRR
mmetsp:Transcript_175197/g.561872  ORF Transcript_175197/g.561872 Transcript_175197/m.561872 type:complete len:235 (-) Transcript_175197:2474-3178(-)